ncbi:MAG: PTPDL family protein [Verrucomicrobiota bacterium]
MFKSPLIVVCTAALFGISAFTLADSVTLKSGEVVEGRIMRESDTEIVIEAKVGSGITDEQTLKKSEVNAVSKTGPDEIAFQKVKDYGVGPNSFPPANYKAEIAALEAFKNQFPISKHRVEVINAIAALTAEKARVEAKDIKWNNHWYSPAEFEKQKYQLRAQLLLAAMREQGARYDTVGALNTFDKLEHDFPGSQAYIDGVELASSLVQRLDGEIDHAVESANLQTSQFNSGIVLVQEPKKTQIIEARQNQIAAAEAAVAKSTAKWKPLLAITDKSPQALKSTLKSEQTRLAALPLEAMRNSVAAADASNAALIAKNVTEAETQARLAQTLWANNEAVTRLLPAIEALKKAATPTPSPSPSPTPKPAVRAKG